LDEWLDRWLKAGGTEDVDSLRADLDVCRSRGYACTPDSVPPGTRAIAAPIRNYTGNVVASVALRTPHVDFDGPALAALGQRVVDTAEQISWHLGYRGGTGSEWRTNR